MNFRLNGEEKARVAARLAVIQLLDRKPEAALKTLQVSAAQGLPQARGGRRGFEMMLGDDHAHPGGAGVGDGRGEGDTGAQLDVDQRGEWQKLREQLASARKAEPVQSALGGMADGDDERDPQPGQRAEQRGRFEGKGIHTDFEEVHLAGLNPERAAQGARRMDSANNLRSGAQNSGSLSAAHILCSPQTNRC